MFLKSNHHYLKYSKTWESPGHPEVVSLKLKRQTFLFRKQFRGYVSQLLIIIPFRQPRY